MFTGRVGNCDIPGLLQVENNYDVIINNGPPFSTARLHAWPKMIPLFTHHVHRPRIWVVCTDHVGKNHWRAMHLPTRPVDTGAWYTLPVFTGSVDWRKWTPPAITSV